MSWSVDSAFSLSWMRTVKCRLGGGGGSSLLFLPATCQLGRTLVDSRILGCIVISEIVITDPEMWCRKGLSPRSPKRLPSRCARGLISWEGTFCVFGLAPSTKQRRCQWILWTILVLKSECIDHLPWDICYPSSFIQPLLYGILCAWPCEGLHNSLGKWLQCFYSTGEETKTELWKSHVLGC